MDRHQTPCPLVPDLFRHLRLLFRVSLLRHAGLSGGGWRAAVVGSVFACLWQYGKSAWEKLRGFR